MMRKTDEVLAIKQAVHGLVEHIHELQDAQKDQLILIRQLLETTKTTALEKEQRRTYQGESPHAISTRSTSD